MGVLVGAIALAAGYFPIHKGVLLRVKDAGYNTDVMQHMMQDPDQ